MKEEEKIQICVDWLNENFFKFLRYVKLYIFLLDLLKLMLIKLCYGCCFKYVWGMDI